MPYGGQDNTPGAPQTDDPRALCDRVLQLAEATDDADFRAVAAHLALLAYCLLDLCQGPGSDTVAAPHTDAEKRSD